MNRFINRLICVNWRNLRAIFFFFVLAFSLQAQTPYYYLNRSFSSVQFDLQGIPTEYQLNDEADKLTDIVQGTIKTNNCYAIEKQMAIPICYGSALSAWNAAVAYNGTPSNYPGKIFDNVGWVRGTKSVNGEWGAYLWVLQNRIDFQSSTSAWWSTTNGIPVAITNVMVGSLGDYQAMSNVVDIGPIIPTNFPWANQSGIYQVDITNVYYVLSIPDIWITPREAVVAVGGSNVQFTVTGTNIPQGVEWSLIPDLSGSGGAAIPSSDAWQAEIMPGNVATNYKVRATSKDNTNFYDQVDLTVLKVEMVNAWETDNVCNRVLNPKQTTSTRLFVATEGSDQAEITVKSSIQPAGTEDKVLCAVYDGLTHLASAPFSSTSEADLSFTPTGPAKNYSWKVGIDADGSGTLESSEFCTTVTNFTVTAFTSAHYNDQHSSLDTDASYSKSLYPLGASLLIHFLNRTDMPEAFNDISSVSTNCFTQSNLTHNAGATFASNGSGTLELNIWNTNTTGTASTRISESYELAAIINGIIDANKAEVTNYFAANPSNDTYTTTWSQNNVPVNFAETSYILHPIEYDLHIAFGHATITSLSITVTVKKGGDLYIDSLVETGTLDDLYDFNYEDGGLAGQAAVLQIGWDPDITGRDVGHIYFDRVNFQETFASWSYSF